MVALRGELQMVQSTLARIAIGILAMALASCTATSSRDYKPATISHIENTIVVDAPFDTTWDRLIKNLSKEFFIINNVEKVSRIINVSFSADRPSDFVDCGVTTRTFVSGGGKKETFTYNGADPSSYKTSDPQTGLPYLITRDTKLEGRANIYVGPSENKTEISVNVRYAFTVNLVVQALHAMYGFPIGAPQSQTGNYGFDTGEPLQKTEAGEYFQCAATGALEKRILEAAQ